MKKLNSNCNKTQIATKLNSNCDITQIVREKKNYIVTKLKNSKCDKTQVVIKLKH